MVFHTPKKNNVTATSRSHPTSVPPDFEQAASIKRIIKMARTTPMDKPSQNFTQNVMQRLSGNSFGPSRLPDTLFLKFRSQMLLKRLMMPASVLELASCFFLTGFFYLVMGLSVFLGVYALDLDSSSIRWLKYQPIIALFIAISFITVGYILLKKTRLAFRIANWAIFCYILLEISNSVMAYSRVSSDTSFSAVLPVLGGTIIMGLFLAMTLNNFQRLSSLPPKDPIDPDGSCAGN